MRKWLATWPRARGSTSTPTRSTSRHEQTTPATRCLPPSLERCVLNGPEFFLSALEHIHTGTRTHAGEDGVQILSNPLEQIHTILSSPFLFIALRRGSLSGAVRSGVDRSRARFAQAWIALRRGSLRLGQANRFMTIFGHGIQSAHRGPFSVGGTRRIPLFGVQPSEPVHDHIWEWNSIPERIPNTPASAYQRVRVECREQRVGAVRVKMALL